MSTIIRRRVASREVIIIPGSCARACTREMSFALNAKRKEIIYARIVVHAAVFFKIRSVATYISS